VGAMPWQSFEGTEAALSRVLTDNVSGAIWPILLSIGAVVATTSVVLTVLYGQTRILYAMSRDGLVPSVFARLSPKTGVPFVNTIIVGLFIAVLAALVPLGSLSEATSIGTLFAFGLVNIAVIILRRTEADRRRSFRVPFSPVTPLVGLGFCVYLMFGLPFATWVAFLCWMVLGFVIYFAYSVRKARLAVPSDQ
jgi:APA family basic amino acid/polyamine antiporter